MIIMINTILVKYRIVSAVKRMEFVSDRMSYIILRGRSFNIIVSNMHEPSEEKSDDAITLSLQYVRMPKKDFALKCVTNNM